MNPIPEFVHAVEAAMDGGITSRDVVAVIRKLLARGKARRFADNLVALDHELRAVVVQHHPFSPEQSDDAIRAVMNCDEVDKSMWLVDREAHAAVMVTQFV